MAKFNYIPKAYNGDGAYIFISYSHQDSEEVLPLVGQLSVDGYRVWYDGGIELSVDWNDYLRKKALGCEYMLCMISDKYVDSMYCCQELDIALSNGIKVIPIYLDEKRFDEARQSILDKLQGIMMSKMSSSEKFFEKLYLTDGLRTCLAPDAESQPEHAEERSALEALKASPAYRIREVLRLVKCGEILSDDIKAKLDEISCDVREKADIIASFWKELQEDIRIIENRERALRVKREAKKTTGDCLEKYISEVLLSADVKRVELTNLITFRHSTSTSISDSEAFVKWAEESGRRDLLKYSPPKPDTAAIKRALEKGESINGAALIANDNIQIK